MESLQFTLNQTNRYFSMFLFWIVCYLIKHINWAHLDDSSYVHLGNHLGGIEEHEQRVQHECYILQWRVMLKGLWGVHTDRDDTDDGAGSKQRMNPLQKEHKKRHNDKMWDYCNKLMSWPEHVCVHSLACWSRRCQHCLQGSHLAQNRSWAGPPPLSFVSSSACWGLPCYTESESNKGREANHTMTKAKWGTGDSSCIQVRAGATQLL